MVHPLIEKNKRILIAYRTCGQIVGWVLFVLAGVVLVWALMFLIPRWETWGAMETHMMVSILEGFTATILFGFLAIGLAQLIRCLLQEKPPGRVLRYGHVILYASAVFVVLSGGLHFYASAALFGSRGGWDFYCGQLVLVLYTIGKAFVFLGLGHALRQVLPIIEESKTLV